MRLETTLRDVRYAARLLLKRRTLSAGVIATIAIVIGASSGIFVTLYDVLLRQLPFADANRLVVLWESDRNTGDTRLPLMEGSYPVYSQQLSTFEGFAAFVPGNPNLPPMTVAGTQDRVNRIYATPELFALLGRAPLLGRPLLPPDDGSVGDTAILSYRFWQRQFLAVAPDLFWRQEPGLDLNHWSEAEWKKGLALYAAYDRDKGVLDIVDTAHAASQLDDASGKVGVMGFCLGGLMAFLTAGRARIDAAVAYHGGDTEKYLDEASGITAPMLMHLAEEDEWPTEGCDS